MNRDPVSQQVRLVKVHAVLSKFEIFFKFWGRTLLLSPALLLVHVTCIFLIAAKTVSYEYLIASLHQRNLFFESCKI